jgi:ubiquinone/menaquinone biosynthesis C-methylase UbiE
MVNWDLYLKNGTHAADLGGGTGWLSAFISKFSQIDKIILVDSNRATLAVMAPGMIKLMSGRPEKISFVEGLFFPLLAKDSSLDAVFICSSLHHADNMVGLLKEINRVLKKEGMLFILNETPFTSINFFLSITKQFLIISRDVLFKKFKPVSPSVSSSGFLYDPFLNDKSYPLWYFKKAIEISGFSVVELVKTGLTTVKNEKGPELTHFICRKE